MNLSLANRYFAMCGILGLILTIANFIGVIAFEESTATHYMSYFAWIFLLLGLIGYLGFPIAVFWMCVKVLQATRSTVIPLTTTL